MMKYVPLLFCCWALYAQADTPEPVQEGTLANQQLIQDAMVGVAGWVATKGCEAPERFVPVVLQPPKGDPGSRYWQERWTVEGCGKQYPAIIDFRETGVDSAMWTIAH
ncbi:MULTISPECIES: hypothetical protein [Aeromonas]|jgi:hypothetical protein|uniref:hypothetical protein n=1 Tax=Aeromonas TaxID=642 RepID=UPI00073C66C2|nr:MULTISPECIES: hypothetical protein [Aeromonas]KTA84314.1 hypothetical protein VO70_11835 [Aeromonas salmonicida]MCW0505268.1 hypothetical protein [Aeromonas piscicola]HEH9407561.1 hypothetical protein [Aeromonas salmonicida]